MQALAFILGNAALIRNFPICNAVGRQLVLRKIVFDSAQKVHSPARTGIEACRKGLVLCIHSHDHALALGAALKNQLAVGNLQIAVIAIA